MVQEFSTSSSSDGYNSSVRGMDRLFERSLRELISSLQVYRRLKREIFNRDEMIVELNIISTSEKYTWLAILIVSLVLALNNAILEPFIFDLPARGTK